MSDEVREILGQIPSWITRWGTTVLFFVIVVLLVGSWFFRFPDVSQARIDVTTLNPPAEVKARTNGKIEKIWVSDKDSVKEGDILAAIQSPVSLDDLRKLDSILKTLNTHTETDSLAFELVFPDNMGLGDMQEDYTSLVKNFKQYRDYLNSDFYAKKIVSLKEQTSKYNLYYSRLWNQRQILEEENTMAEEQYNTARGLFEKQAISKRQLEQARSDMLKKNFEFEKVRTQLADTKMKMENIKQDIIDLEQEHTETQKQYERNLFASLEKLKSGIADYKYNYLLEAPVSGKVSFTHIWNPNQNVVAGEKVFTVVPFNSGELTGRIQLPVQGSGKVKQGQKVIIRFDNYPYMDFGMVTGYVKGISLVADENYYLVEVRFENGLTTNYGKELPFTGTLLGTAEIITENVRLIEKLIKPVRAIFEKQKSL